jgi:hypothetical protein
LPEAEPCAISKEAIPVQSSEKEDNEQGHSATDNKVERSQENRFARKFAETELCGNGTDPGISRFVVRAIHDMPCGCGGLFRVCCEETRSEKTEKLRSFERRGIAVQEARFPALLKNVSAAGWVIDIGRFVGGCCSWQARCYA